MSRSDSRSEHLKPPLSRLAGRIGALTGWLWQRGARRLAVMATLATASIVGAQPAPTVSARAWLLLDYSSGQILASEEPDRKIEPASLTKLMTAYLSFQAIAQGTLKPDQLSPVSERAWKAEGSRMFIEPGKPASVEQLLYGVIVQSGNDACIALAEAIAGSEEQFAAMMNREAGRLGMRNTRFMNSTGLPHPEHRSTARDLAILVSALIRDHPKFYRIYSTRDYTYNGITQPNRNRLLWVDPTVDGVKTGHTEGAGYCLIASAQRGPRRLVAVVLGASSDNVRAQDALKLLNHGFQSYDTVTLYKAGEALRRLRLFKGEQSEVGAGFPAGLTLSLPKGQSERLKASWSSVQPLVAPIRQGQQVGTLKLELDGRSLGEYPVLALESVAPAGWLGRLWDSIRLWLQ
jgi:D-alanyl-D-alanine carboxypeptidase (penicillin-binding protein 5/6)